MPRGSSMGGSVQWNLTLGRREAELVQALANDTYDGNRSQALRAIIRLAEAHMDRSVVNARPTVIGGKKYAWVGE